MRESSRVPGEKVIKKETFAKFFKEVIILTVRKIPSVLSTLNKKIKLQFSSFQKEKLFLWVLFYFLRIKID